MWNIYLKVTIETFSKLPFFRFKTFVTRSVFGELQLTQITLNFKTSCSNLKIRGIKTVCGFSIILILKGIMTLSWSYDELELAKEKRGHFFVPFFFPPNQMFFNICVLSQCIVCWIRFQNIHTVTYQKTLLHTLLLLVFKIVKRLHCILKSSIFW